MIVLEPFELDSVIMVEPFDGLCSSLGDIISRLGGDKVFRHPVKRRGIHEDKVPAASLM
jgi:hypothetical protein